MWPFLSARMRGTLPAATWRYLVAAPGATVLAAVKQWPKQLHAELPAYPKRSAGTPAEEAKCSLERKIARCGLEKLVQGRALASRPAPDPDSDSD